MVEGSQPGKNPWYVRAFLGGQVSLSLRQVRTISFLCLASVCATYEFGFLNAALPQVAEDLGLAAGETGLYVGLIRGGGLLSLLVLPLADRFGRRPIFLAALVAFVLGILVSFVSTTVPLFVAAQVWTYAFALAVQALAIVIVVDELPVSSHGAAVSMVMILGGVGMGLASVFYAWVDVIPWGWRGLLAVPALAVFLLPAGWQRLSAALPESGGQERGGVPGLGWWTSLREVVRSQRWRVASIAAVGILLSMSVTAVEQYASYFVQVVHGWGPADYSWLFVVGGGVGGLGTVLGGRASDCFGRRRVGLGVLLPAPLAAWLFFQGPAFLLVVAWAGWIFCVGAAILVLRTFVAELFPADQRAGSVGWLYATQAVGSAVGLFAIGTQTASVGDLAVSVALVSLGTALAAVFLAFLPETNLRNASSGVVAPSEK